MGGCGLCLDDSTRPRRDDCAPLVLGTLLLVSLSYGYFPNASPDIWTPGADDADFSSTLAETRESPGTGEWSIWTAVVSPDRWLAPFVALMRTVDRRLINL